MFCENCGTKLEDGAVFCTNCGAKLAQDVAPDFKPEENVAPEAPATDAPVNGAPVAGDATNNAAGQVPPVPPVQGQVPPMQGQVPPMQGQPMYQAAPQQKKPFPVKLAVIGGVVLAALIVLIVFVKMQSGSINLNKYVTVDFEGYDTVGKAVVTIDPEFYDDFQDKAKKGSYVDEWTLQDYITYTTDPEANLSNGDEVSVKWDVNAKYLKKKYGVNVKYKDSTYKVKDLEEVDLFSPFDNIEVVFTGIDGNGQCEITVTGKDAVYKQLEFRADNSYDLSEGDEVVITMQSKDYLYDQELSEWIADKYGVVPDMTEKTYTVEGLGNYVTEASQITEENIQDIKKHAEDVLTQEYNDSSEGISLTESVFKGVYVLTEKTSGENKVYLVYQLTNQFEDEGQTDSCTYYTYVEYDDVVINPAGELSTNLSYYNKCYNSYRYTSSIESGWWANAYYLYGYETLEELNDDVVTGNLANYNADSSVTE